MVASPAQASNRGIRGHQQTDQDPGEAGQAIGIGKPCHRRGCGKGTLDRKADQWAAAAAAGLASTPIASVLRLEKAMAPISTTNATLKTQLTPMIDKFYAPVGYIGGIPGL